MKQEKKTQLISPNHKVYAAAFIVVLLMTLFFVVYSKRLILIGKEAGIQSAAVLGTTAQKVSNGVIEMTVGSSVPAASIPKVYEVEKGTSAICIDISVRNISGSEKLFIPLEEVELIDTSTNKSYDISGVLTCAPGVGGPLQVGEVLTGRLGFLLPENYGKLEFRYNPLDKNTKSFIISTQ